MRSNTFLTRALLAAVALALLTTTVCPAVAGPASRTKGGRPMTQDVLAFRARTIDGADRSLADYRGRVLLIVNTASRCGFTPQYASLEKIYREYRERGFEVLAFPANNFMNQEPGSDAEIKNFCSTRYETSFPLFAKVSVKGRDITPLYSYLTRESPFPGDIGWNFTKFLVGRDGRVVARFDPKTDPADAKVTEAIERALAAKAPAAAGGGAD